MNHYSYTSVAYTQTVCQLTTSAALSMHVTCNHDLVASLVLQCVLSFNPHVTQ